MHSSVHSGYSIVLNHTANALERGNWEHNFRPNCFTSRIHSPRVILCIPVHISVLSLSSPFSDTLPFQNCAFTSIVWRSFFFLTTCLAPYKASDGLPWENTCSCLQPRYPTYVLGYIAFASCEFLTFGRWIICDRCDRIDTVWNCYNKIMFEDCCSSCQFKTASALSFVVSKHCCFLRS